MSKITELRLVFLSVAALRFINKGKARTLNWLVKYFIVEVSVTSFYKIIEFYEYN
jgi:hypothetical protein